LVSELNYYSFVETAVFTRQVDSKASLDVLYAIQNDLLANPKRGDIVQGTGGVRKARVADPQSGRGKRDSYRYLYLYLEHRGRIYLLYLYGKNEQSDLSPEQKKTVARLAQLVKEESK
jgi:hypothetical protein